MYLTREDKVRSLIDKWSLECPGFPIEAVNSFIRWIIKRDYYIAELSDEEIGNALLFWPEFPPEF